MIEDKELTRLGVWDYVSLCSIFILTSIAGVYQVFAARKSKNAREFLVASKDLGFLPIILSIIGSVVSAVTILGYPAEVYMNGVTIMFYLVGFWLAIPIGVYLYVPMFYRLGSISVFEYLELRFNKFLRMLACSLAILGLIFFSSLAIYAPSMAVNQVTGLHLWTSVSVIGISCVVYTSLGGIRGVIWADAFQTIVMLFSVIFIACKETFDVGGLSTIWSTARKGNRTEIFTSPSNDNSNYTIWTMLIGGPFSYLSFMCATQTYIQRYLLNKTLTRARMSFLGGTVVVSINHFLIMFCGIILYTRYHDCDPLAAGKVTSRDQLFVLFAFETLSFCKGLVGVFVAFILCATLSTLSSTINATTALTMEDFIRPFVPQMTEVTALKLSKCLVIAYGITCIAVVGLIQMYSGIVKIMFAITGILEGPVFAVFTIGMLLPWVNSAGAIAAIVSGFLLCSWACVGNLVTKSKIYSAPVSISGCGFNESIANNMSWSMPDSRNSPEAPLYLYTLSSIWYPSWCIVIGIVAAVVVSIMTGIQKPENVDPKLIFPFMTTVIKKLQPSFNISTKIDSDYSNSPKIKNVRREQDIFVNRQQLLEPSDRETTITTNSSC